jgi:hypothetical protein
MSVVRAARSGLVRAPAPVVYALLEDYRNGHPRILPARYFPKLEVERGGTGAGTIIRFQVRLFGATREIRSAITEPTPGQVLVEGSPGVRIEKRQVDVRQLVEGHGRQACPERDAHE